MKKTPTIETPKFSESICSKVHEGLHHATPGRARSILARTEIFGAIKLEDNDILELQIVADFK